MNFLNTLKAIQESNIKKFKSLKELYEYIEKMRIGRFDKFKFIVAAEPNTIFNSLFELEHEG